ncbi:MAG TPA: Ig-like domain-containing protein [Thermoanaerobaculia bacterium]|nr:Ig-like domain-containing protein [Thermoanaerobaculia bacterium]
MTPIRVVTVAAFALLLASLALAQPAPLPPAVGNAVLLATNSIQVDRNVHVVSGDLVVNAAPTSPILGEQQLSIDQGVTTPAGFALKANAVDIDAGASVAGSVYYNSLQNNGAIAGTLNTPLALPVISQLPTLGNATAGTQNFSVANGQTQVIGTGAYGALSVDRNATVRLPGGPYVFASITLARGATIVWDGPGEVDIIGGMTLGADCTISVAPGVTTKHRLFLVHGSNGITFGSDNSVSSTFFAPNGKIDAGNGSKLLGSFVGRDIHVGRDSTLELRSAFRNLPPIAISQSVLADGSPVAITLTGLDPDNDPLTFAIASPPSHGSLSAVSPNGPTSATVIYSPGESNPDDAFLFRVTDSEGFDAIGSVVINEGTPPSPPTTIEAHDATVEVLNIRPANIVLPAVAPPGVAVTLSIVAGSGPSQGTLGPLQQPSLMPRHPGSVVYVPAPGYVGSDAFSYQACGTIAGNPVCANGTITLNVGALSVEPPDLAPDFTILAASNDITPINLSPTPRLEQPPPQPPVRFHATANASFVTPAAVAGDVADANGDGFGDNHNALPGLTPVLMSAGVGQTGGPGSNGTTRMHFEWDVTSISGIVDSLATATVILHTNRGTIDSLDTFIYFVGDEGDGALSDGDYDRPAEPLRFVLKVPPTMPVGADGTFAIDVLEPLKAAIHAGFTHFTLQGRVNETTAGPARGLQVYTSAAGNGPKSPELAVSTAVAASRTYRILSLPANGTLKDSAGTLISSTPYTLANSFVLYRSNSGFVGQDGFSYNITEGATTDAGAVTLSVHAGDCATDPAFCNDGR